MVGSRADDQQRRQRFSVIHGTFAMKEAALSAQMQQLEQELQQQRSAALAAAADAQQQQAAAAEATGAVAETEDLLHAAEAKVQGLELQMQEVCSQDIG